LAGVLADPALGVASDSVVAALVTERPQLLEQSDQRQTLARGIAGVSPQHSIDLGLPPPELGSGLDLPFIGKRRLA
jgi:hypothetical protein